MHAVVPLVLVLASRRRDHLFSCACAVRERNALIFAKRKLSNYCYLFFYDNDYILLKWIRFSKI